jgi:hypothetical protein
MLIVVCLCAYACVYLCVYLCVCVCVFVYGYKCFLSMSDCKRHYVFVYSWEFICIVYCFLCGGVVGDINRYRYVCFPVLLHTYMRLICLCVRRGAQMYMSYVHLYLCCVGAIVAVQICACSVFHPRARACVYVCLYDSEHVKVVCVCVCVCVCWFLSPRY